MYRAFTVAFALLCAAAPATGQVFKPSQQWRPRTPTGITIVDTGAIGVFPATDAKTIAFMTDEGAVGQDLNGDSFVTPAMYVIRLYDIATGVVTNTGQEGYHPSVHKDYVAFHRLEQNGGIPRDWNLDGDFQDKLIAYYRISTGITVDTLADGYEADILGDRIAFTTQESSVGPLPGTDLNGDGDTADPVIRWHRISTGVTTNTGAAGEYACLTGALIGFSAWETWLWDSVGGGVEIGVITPDLNLDGDFTDWILRVHDTGTGITTSTNAEGQLPTIWASEFAAMVPELDDDGPIDHTTDVDTQDAALFSVNKNTFAPRNTMFAISGRPTIYRNTIGYDCEEFNVGCSSAPAMGTELNENANKLEHIVCAFDLRTGSFLSTGVTGYANSGDSLFKNVLTYSHLYAGTVGYVVLP
jgi:hypothetical protein